MIELSGLDPDRDIDIEIVGARPGEKVHEALFNSYERPRPTGAEKILRAEREPLAVAQVEAMFREIILLVLEGDAAGLAAKVAELSAELRGPGPDPSQGAPDPGSDGASGGSSDGTPSDVPAARPDAPNGARKIMPSPARAGAVEEAVPGTEAPEPLVHSPNS
jgi:hypothetical protein